MCLPLFVAAFGLVFHFGGKEVHRFERLAECDLSHQLGVDIKNVSVRIKLGSLQLGHLAEVSIDAKNFTVEELPLSTESWRSRAGKIERLQIHLSDFTLGKLPFKELKVTLIDSRWDVTAAMRDRRFHFSRSGKGSFEATIDEVGLRTYISRRYPQVIPELVSIDLYKMTLEGNLVTPFGSSRFVTLAKGILSGPRTLSLAPAYLTFDGVSASDQLKKTFLKTLNPVIDLDRDFNLNGALSMTGIWFKKGEMVIVGTATIPEAK
jgi:hypothetical protein